MNNWRTKSSISNARQLGWIVDVGIFLVSMIIEVFAFVLDRGDDRDEGRALDADRPRLLDADVGKGEGERDGVVRQGHGVLERARVVVGQRAEEAKELDEAVGREVAEARVNWKAGVDQFHAASGDPLPEISMEIGDE